MKRTFYVTDILGLGKAAEAFGRMRELKPCVPKITRAAKRKWAIHRGHDGTWDQKLVGEEPVDHQGASRLREL